MIVGARARPLLTQAAILGGVASTQVVLLGLVATHRVVPAVALALLPLIALAMLALVRSNRLVLVGAALGLSLTIPPLQEPLPLSVPGSVYVTDLIVLASIGSWALGRFTTLRPEPARWPRAPVLGWPLLLLAGAVLSAAIRGHVEYGANIVGQPVRLVAYAAIGFALTDLDPDRLLRLVVGVYYAGAAWMFLNALYLLATGGHQTDQVGLSTGGARTLSLTVGICLTAALLLALLNFHLEDTSGRRVLHIVIAGLATFGIVLAFGRAVFLSLAVTAPLPLILSSRIRRGLVAWLPLCLPAFVLVTLLIPRAMPQLIPTLVDRVATAPSADVNVRWRQAAAAAVLEQARESPVVGAGFGRDSTFTFAGVRRTITQDPHNSYVYLLAGGGVLALGSFLLLVLVSLIDSVRRLLGARRPRERILIAWAVLALVVYMVNAAAEPVLSNPPMLLTIWTLILLPVCVEPGPRERGPAPARG